MTIAESVAQPTLCAAFQITARENAGRAALRLADSDEVVTWDQYAERVRTVAGGLHALGVRAGDAVALLLRNSPAFHVTDAAVLHLGATPFSLYHTEPVERMVALLADSGAQVLVTETAFAERAVVAAERSGARLVADPAQLEAATPADFDFEATWRAVDPETAATLVYTSGTTGEPKAVRIPHRAIMHSLAGVEVLAPATPDQRCVSFLPNAHISDRFMCHYSVIGLGGSVTSVPDHERLWDTLRAVRPTRFHGVPRTFEKLADAAREQIDADPGLSAAYQEALARLRGGDPVVHPALAPVREQLGLDQVEWLSVAAAPSAYSVLEFHHAIGLDLAEVWGMSEFMMATMNPPGRTRIGTVGIALPAVEAAAGADGELLVRGPHACLGAARDADGWQHTGDLATIDEDGYIKIVGRKKEVMINSSGKNLFPAKIEAAIKEGAPLLGHVVAIADKRRYVAALIVIDPDELRAAAAARGLRADRTEPWVKAEVERAIAAGNARLSRVEQVRAWTILDAEWKPGGPEVTNTHKLRRGTIDERYAEQIEAMYA
jgi:long-subunit acyl-CoA synthetase (AMP-forming)